LISQILVCIGRLYRLDHFSLHILWIFPIHHCVCYSATVYFQGDTEYPDHVSAKVIFISVSVLLRHCKHGLLEVVRTSL
jgi:hypothetical protein